MYKRTFTYTDFDGNERTEDAYFHFSKSEVIMMELSEAGGFGAKLQRIVDAKEGPEIIATFKEIILAAYGEKSPDGRRIVKSPEISKAFSETPMFDELFMELATNDKVAADFINHVIPAEILKEAQEAIPQANQQ